MSILRLPHTVIATMRRFPEVMVVCWIYMVLNILQIHGYGKAALEPAVGAVSLGIPLALEIQLLIERFWPAKAGVRLVLDIVGIGILILYYCFFSSGHEALSRYDVFQLALVGLCVVTPYFRRNDKFEWFLWQLLRRGIIAIGCWLVLSGCVEATAHLVGPLLFHKDVSSNIFADLRIALASLFLPVFFCAGISEYPVKLDLSNAPKWWHTVLAYLAVPALAGYTVILYLYFAKMLIRWHWPKGDVASLVISYALLLTVALILAYPYRRAKPWLGRFVFFAPRLLLPLLGLMLIDIGMRIQACGVTERRYFVVLAGLFMIGCMVYYIAANTVKNTMIVSGAVLLAFLAVIGPWSCFAVSDYSQDQRFQALLIKHHMLQDGKLHNAEPSFTDTDADRQEMVSIMWYFKKKGRVDALPYLPSIRTEQQLYVALGLAHSSVDGEYQHFQHEVDVCQMNTMDIRGMDYVVTATGESGNSMLDSAPEIVLSYDAASDEIKLTKAKQLLYSKNISEFVAKIHQKAQGRTVLTRSEMMFTDENEHVVVHYAFAKVSGEINRSGKVAAIYAISGQPFQLAIKLK